MSEKKEISRRDFLRVATISIGGLIGLGYVVPAVTYIIGPSLQRSTEKNWIKLGSPGRVEIGVPTLYTVTIERQTGWIVTKEDRSFYVYTEDGREFVAMSNVCTHLGCRIRWIAEQDHFACPCHNGIFDKQGNVTAGPPPRPLDRYEVKVEGDYLYVLGG